jgi:ssDNA-binding Zn-finger/Zn-ribbon topoisomerase 1
MAKQATASLYISVLTDCPYCDEGMDLMNAVSGVEHNDAGAVISQACPNGNWSESHAAFKVTDVTCPECGKSFTVSGLEW